jgi:hypothetical protein
MVKRLAAVSHSLLMAIMKLCMSAARHEPAIRLRRLVHLHGSCVTVQV